MRHEISEHEVIMVSHLHQLKVIWLLEIGKRSFLDFCRGWTSGRRLPSGRQLRTQPE